MGDHHSLCLWGKRFFQAGYINIVLRDRHIHKNRNRSVLDHRSHCCGEACRHCDHLVSRQHLAFLQKGRGQRHKRQKVG